MKDKIELLAPAGNMECFVAAINAGADAVYIGGDKFSARAYASNFDLENISNALDYAHLRGIKVYITINTLIKEQELQEAVEYIKALYIMGADAIIIQDPGLAYLVEAKYPEMELHASTQMTIHNGEGASYLTSKGFKRIVLSRELTLKEIEYISKDLKIETEMFVHGALCICYSGQCLMSSLIGGRSGNRGRCAQACRMSYTLINTDDNSIKDGYLLSPKDMCTIDEIRDIIESGTASLKVEGRMKRVEYVAGVVTNYRAAIDSVLSMEVDSFSPSTSKEELLQLFNREGFSRGYLHGNPGLDLMAIHNPKNTGVLLGTVKKDNLIALNTHIEVKDGVSIGSKGFTLSKIVDDNGKSKSRAEKGEKVKLYPMEYKKGDVLYKTSSESLNVRYKAYGIKSNKKIASLDVDVTFRVNHPITLEAVYNDKTYMVTGEVVQIPINRPTSVEKLIDSLNKTGEFFLGIDNIHINEYEEGFIPVSAINKARRELLERIEDDIKESYRRDPDAMIKREIKDDLEKSGNIRLPDYLISVSTLEQLRAFSDSSFNSVAVNLFDRKGNITEESLAIIKGKEIYLRIPTIVRQEFETVASLIERNLEKISGILTSNLGIINRFKGRTNIIGDYKLNIFNSYSTRFFKNELQGLTPSLELNKGELKKLSKGSALPLQAFLYGKVEMMIMEYCPIGGVIGGKGENHSCNLACERGNYIIKDRLNKEFKLHTDKFCRCSLMNSVPVNIIDKQQELVAMGIGSFRIEFTDESYEESIEIMNFLRKENYAPVGDSFTRGHYKRGVE